MSHPRIELVKPPCITEECKNNRLAQYPVPCYARNIVEEKQRRVAIASTFENRIMEYEHARLRRAVREVKRLYSRQQIELEFSRGC